MDNMDFVNAIILLLNYIIVPALSYGSQLALGAIFVTIIYGHVFNKIGQMSEWMDGGEATFEWMVF